MNAKKTAATLAVALMTLAPVMAKAQTGVAYDEVIEQYTARPLPLPKDFPAVLADTANKAGAVHRMVLHIAQLGQLRRTQYTDGTVILDRPDLGEYVHLDPAAKTYWTFPWKPRETYSTGPVLPFKNLTGTATAVIESVHDTWPAILIDGKSYRGESVRAIMQVNPSTECKLAQALAFITIFATDSIPEREYPDRLYVAPFNFEPATLSAMSGCNVTVVGDLLSHFPTYPGFILYRAAQVVAAPADLRFREVGNVPVALMMRGNVRVLTDADRSLFEIPTGYQHVAAPANQSSCFQDARVLTQSVPEYPPSARAFAPGTRTVAILVTLDAAGKVVSEKIFRSSGVDPLDQAALRAAAQSTFAPKISDCKAVPGEYIFRVTFAPQ